MEQIEQRVLYDLMQLRMVMTIMIISSIIVFLICDVSIWYIVLIVWKQNVIF